MATCKVNYYAEVERPIESVELTLSAEEARILRDVLGHVGGNIAHGDEPPTPRNLIDRILNAVEHAGFTSSHHNRNLTGRICVWTEDYPARKRYI